jgi:hypothetical protein
LTLGYFESAIAAIDQHIANDSSAHQDLLDSLADKVDFDHAAERAYKRKVLTLLLDSYDKEPSPQFSM